MKTFLSFLLLILFSVCSGQDPTRKNGSVELKWSVRMANTVLARSDSLIYYVDRNPKWAYDVALLGMAIDRLGNIDVRYSAYMENWVNHFVRNDGSIIDYKLKDYNLDKIFPGRNLVNLCEIL